MSAATLSRRGFTVGAAAIAAGVLTGCGGKKRPTSAPRQVEKVSVLTGAGFQGREAPIFVARAKGWFAEAGLEVTVLPGRGTTENLKTLVEGKATFATLDVSGATIEYSKPGGITDFRLTSVLHQRNLACFLALESSGIKTPRDLPGKKITYLPGGINHVLFGTYAKLAGFAPAGITWVNVGPPTNATLLAERRVDAISQFVPARGAVQALAEQPVVMLPFSDVLTDLHGSAIGVSTKTAKDRPDQVRAFNRVLIRGLQYAIDHPEEAGQIYSAQKETQGQPQPLAAAVGEVKGMTGYVHPAGGVVPLGHFDQDRVARNIAILQGAAAIPGGLTPDQVVSFDLAG